MLFLLLDERLSADALLKKIIPYGKLPTMPDGFPRLENLTTDRFDVKAAGHTTVLTSELDQPVGLLGDSMKLEDVSMTFRYKDKRRKKGRWEFHAQGIFIVLEQLKDLRYLTVIHRSGSKYHHFH